MRRVESSRGRAGLKYHRFSNPVKFNGKLNKTFNCAISCASFAPTPSRVNRSRGCGGCGHARVPRRSATARLSSNHQTSNPPQHRPSASRLFPSLRSTPRHKSPRPRQMPKKNNKNSQRSANQLKNARKKAASLAPPLAPPASPALSAPPSSAPPPSITSPPAPTIEPFPPPPPIEHEPELEEDSAEIKELLRTREFTRIIPAMSWQVWTSCDDLNWVLLHGMILKERDLPPGFIFRSVWQCTSCMPPSALHTTGTKG